MASSISQTHGVRVLGFILEMFKSHLRVELRGSECARIELDSSLLGFYYGRRQQGSDGREKQENIDSKAHHSYCHVLVLRWWILG